MVSWHPMYSIAIVLHSYSQHSFLFRFVDNVKVVHVNMWTYVAKGTADFVGIW